VRGADTIALVGRLLDEGRNDRELLARRCNAVGRRRGGQWARPWLSPRPTPKIGSGMGGRGPNAVRGLCLFRDADRVYMIGAEGTIELPS